MWCGYNSKTEFEVCFSANFIILPLYRFFFFLPCTFLAYTITTQWNTVFPSRLNLRSWQLIAAVWGDDITAAPVFPFPSLLPSSPNPLRQQHRVENDTEAPHCQIPQAGPVFHNTHHPPVTPDRQRWSMARCARRRAGGGLQTGIPCMCKTGTQLINHGAGW